MPDPGDHQPDEHRSVDHPPDSTVELRTDRSLADDLLSPDRDATLEDRPDVADAGTASALEPDEEDDYFDPHAQRRGRGTTGLIVALIFALGMLCGVLVGRALMPAPQPQIVYLLNDVGASPEQHPPSPSTSTR
jgi:hypothetical protein